MKILYKKRREAEIAIYELIDRIANRGDLDADDVKALAELARSVF